MHNPSIMWSNLEGSRKASIFFTVWDGTDGKALGMHHYDFPNNTNSLSKKIVKGFMTRLGCDGRPGSRGVVDACGRCGGNGRWCRGCDGVTFSGAKMGEHQVLLYKIKSPKLLCCNSLNYIVN